MLKAQANLNTIAQESVILKMTLPTGYLTNLKLLSIDPVKQFLITVSIAKLGLSQQYSSDFTVILFTVVDSFK